MALIATVVGIALAFQPLPDFPAHLSYGSGRQSQINTRLGAIQTVMLPTALH